MNVAVVQSNISNENRNLNVARYEKMLGSLETHPDLIVLPEMFNVGFGPNLQEYAVRYGNDDVEFLKSLSKNFSSPVVGSTAIAENGNVYNRLFWVSDDVVEGRYDKRHLFFGDEKNVCKSGDNKMVVECCGMKFLPLICYDVRFPLWSRNYYVSDDFMFDCIVYIANFPSLRIDVLKVLAKARAIENQCYVIVVNRVGENGNGELHCGGSMFVNYDGEILAEAKDDGEQVLSYNLCKEKLVAYRNKFPVYKDWD